MLIPALNWTTGPTGHADDDLLTDILVGKVALMVRGRNAWHSTWVQHYFQNAMLFTDSSSAKLAAESHRGPGNVFYIIEAPAIQLLGTQSNVVICEAASDNPFEEFVGIENHEIIDTPYGRVASGIYPGVSVREAVEYVYGKGMFWRNSPPGEDSLRAGRLQPGTSLDPNILHFEEYTSRAKGADRYLVWYPEDSNYRADGALQLSSHWYEVFRDVFSSAETDGSISARILDYRDNILSVKSEAHWESVRKEARENERTRRAQLDASFSESVARVHLLEGQLEDAEDEREDAFESLLNPADSSQKIRVQRERFERAEKSVHEVESALTRAEQLKAEALAALRRVRLGETRN